MKVLPFRLIKLPGHVMKRARQLVVRLADTHPALEVLMLVRQHVAALAATPAG